jgi:hypothetical protein
MTIAISQRTGFCYYYAKVRAAVRQIGWLGTKESRPGMSSSKETLVVFVDGNQREAT